MKEGYTMRDYQRNFCNAVWRTFEKGTAGGPVTRVLGAAATGAGKTIMASALIEKRVARNERALFLADRDELVAQAADKIHKATGIFADIEKAERRASLRSDVVVASIQSMTSNDRFQRFPADHFGLVVADEAHLSMADNWQRCLGYFDSAGTHILGITATPERGDGIPLMKFYEHLAYEISLKTLIEARHLSPIMVKTVPLEIAVKGRVSDGDMNDIGEQMAAYTEAIIDEIEAHAADRKSILIFHPSRKASRDFSDRLLARGHGSMHVQGDSKDRAQIVAGFTKGNFKVLNNAQMLTTGFDAPLVDCVIILRPTESRTSYVQMVGRGTRLHCPAGCIEWCDHPQRKQDMLLLDFMWQFPGMKLMAPANLTTDNREQAEAMTKKLLEPGAKNLLDVDAAVFGEREELMIKKLKAAVFGEREELMIKKLKAASRQRGMFLDARSFGAVMHQPELMDYQPTAKWETRPATAKQLALLQRKGIDTTGVTLGMASRMIDALMARHDQNLATAKQVMTLRDKGVKDAHLLDFDAASAMIGDLLRR